MSPPQIRFSQHALLKFEILRAHGVDLDERIIEETLEHPTQMSAGYQGRLVAQGPLDEQRVLRVVYEETPEEIVVITFYPGRRERYEQDTI